MNNLDKKDSLRSKFSEVEVAVESDIKFKLNESVVQNKNDQSTTSSLYLKSIFITSKICVMWFLGFIKFVFFNLLIPGIKSISKKIHQTYVAFREKNAEKEIILENYLRNVEAKIELSENNLKKNKLEKNNILKEYEKVLCEKFEEGICNVKLDAEQNEIINSTTTLKFALEIFDFINQKLNESKLITNVDFIKINSTIDKKIVSHTIEFELKISGPQWATIFSKFIAKSVHQKLDWVEGKSEGIHTQNITLIRDTYKFTFTHHKIEILKLAQEINNSFNQEV
jgi:hypothetical protein